MKITVKILAAKNIIDLIQPTDTDAHIEIIPVEQDDSDIVEKIACVQPDIAFINMFMSGLDAVRIINSYSSLFTSSRPYFAVLCSFASDRLTEELRSCGVGSILLKPYSSKEISDIIVHIYKQKQTGSSWKISTSVSTVHKIHEVQSNQGTEKIVADVLNNLGIYDCIAGYNYLKRAIVLAVENEDMMYSVTRSIYPQIAAEFCTTPSGVERRIRHAIIAAWEKGSSNVIESYFGCTINNMRGKPANSEFIAMVADRIRLNMRRVNYFAV